MLSFLRVIVAMRESVVMVVVATVTVSSISKPTPIGTPPELPFQRNASASSFDGVSAIWSLNAGLIRPAHGHQSHNKKCLKKFSFTENKSHKLKKTEKNYQEISRHIACFIQH